MNLFTDADLEQIRKHGKTIDEVKEELKSFSNGFPYVSVASSAAIGRGILKLSDSEAAAYEKKADSGKDTITKFVPASGAASRMFKDLFTGLDNIRSGKGIDSKTAKFAENFDRFPFAGTYEGGKSADSETDCRSMLEFVLTEKGLDYGNRPKGLVIFHKYADGTTRTAFEEHFIEGATYAKSADGKVRMHFTVSEEYMELFKNELARIKPVYEKRFGCTYDVTFSIQDPATDTIAANADNTPFRKDDGTLLFRPAGHGALIRNLANIDSDIIAIKNIDNVVAEASLADTIHWKKVLIGALKEIRNKVYEYVRWLRPYTEEGSDISVALLPDERLSEIEIFISHIFYADCEALRKLAGNDLLEYVKLLLKTLDRPLRVCGMVRNEGEPGGGPFVVKENDGTVSLQILESSQINKADSTAVAALESSSHFNPVDLVCSIRNCDGKKYDLNRFVDKNAGFISSKSYEGRELKALELPGLWNGAMSKWNTVFIEVPVSTFNPVKTVMDLLGR